MKYKNRLLLSLPFMILYMAAVVPDMSAQGESYQPQIIYPANDTFVCHNVSVNIKINQPPSNWTAVLQYRTTNSTWIDLDNFSATTYTTSPLDSTVYFFRVKAAPFLSINHAYSDSVCVNVYPAIIPGSIATPPAICSGNTPDSLVLENPFTGGDGNFTYTWMWSNDAQTWFQVDNYTIHEHDQWYSYIVENLCGRDTTQPVLVKAFQPIVAPHIAELDIDSLCYGTLLDALLYMDTLPTGGDTSYLYQWQHRVDTSSWENIEGATLDEFLLDTNIYETTSYRLVVNAENTRKCTPAYSDSITFNVLPQINPGTIDAHDTLLCYHTRTLISFSEAPSVGDMEYSILWMTSTDGVVFDSLRDDEGTVLTDTLSIITPYLDSMAYYQAIVSTNRCYEKTNIVSLTVLSPFVTSNIHINFDDTQDTVADMCSGVSGETNFSFAVDTAAYGGSGLYSYLWFSSVDSTYYYPISSSNNNPDYYSPNVLESTTWFRLVTTDEKCGSDTSNSLMVIVHPLPETPTLGGDTRHLCNSDNILRYWVAPNEDLTYLWSSVDVDTLYHEDSSTVFLRWKKDLDNVSLNLRLTETVYGCSREVAFDSIAIDTTHKAPDTTAITLKRGARMLICQDANPKAHYQWGHTSHSTGEDSYYDSSDYRYIQLPDSIDIDAYDYFVIVTYDSICFTRSFYSPEASQSADNNRETPSLKIAPNPSFGDITCSFDIDIDQTFTIKVFDTFGQKVFEKNISGYTKGDCLPISLDLKQGLYILSVITNDWSVSHKIFVRQ